MTAKKKKADRKKAGRKTKKTPEVLRKIEEVAALDGSVAEMAYYADVHVDTIYGWMEKDKAFSERIAKLRNRPVLLARQTVVKKITESYSNAMDFLKRKKRLEFGDNVDHTSLGKEMPQPIYGGVSKDNGEIQRHDSDKEDIPTEQED